MRARIHRLFTGRASLPEGPTDTPPFWVPPTEEQKRSVVLHRHDGVVPQDKRSVAAEERRWLEAPHPMLGGKSPEGLLRGDEDSRQRLERSLTAIEDAVAGGFFR